MTSYEHTRWREATTQGQERVLEHLREEVELYAMSEDKAEAFWAAIDLLKRCASSVPFASAPVDPQRRAVEGVLAETEENIERLGTVIFECPAYGRDTDGIGAEDIARVVLAELRRRAGVGNDNVTLHGSGL